MNGSAKDPIPGSVGWGLTFLVVGLWDLHPRTQTMSTAFNPRHRDEDATREDFRTRTTRFGKPVYLLGAVYVMLHLTRLIPERYDPLRRIPSLKRSS